VRLRTGERLLVTITSDHDDSVHAHGFEIKKALKAGVPTTMTLAIGEPGLYDVETHDPVLRLFQVAVR